MGQIKIGLIGGSGLGQALGAENGVRRHEIDTPFGRPSDAIIETEWSGLPVFILSRHGPGHLLNPSQVPSRANIFALKTLGCTHVIASGAVGSLREEFKPRDLVIPDQIIDKTTRRAGTFYENAAVHVELAEPFCPVLRQMLIEGSGVRGQGSVVSLLTPDPRPLSPAVLTPDPSPPTPAFKVHDGGCYVCMEGPAFSTRAESHMHRLWGGDLIGMTAMPEAKLAREAEISYALIALVTDYDCWRPHKPPADQTAPDPAVLLKEIIGNLQSASENGIGLMRAAVELISQRPGELADCSAHHALSLAIWSNKSAIPVAEIERLRPLWGRYF